MMSHAFLTWFTQKNYRHVEVPQEMTTTARVTLQASQLEQQWQALLSKPTPTLLEQQLAYYHEQLKENPQHPVALVRYAWCEWLSGCLLAVEGMGATQRSIELAPTLSEAWHFQAFFQHQCGLRLPALTSLQRALALSPLGNSHSRKLYLSWLASYYQAGEITPLFWLTQTLVAYWSLTLSVACQGLKQLMGVPTLTQGQMANNMANNTVGSVVSTHQSVMPPLSLLDAKTKPSKQTIQTLLAHEGSPRLSATQSIGGGGLALVDSIESRDTIDSKGSVAKTWMQCHPKLNPELAGNSPEQAIETLEEWVNLHPAELEAQLALAELCQQYGQNIKALYYCRLVINQVPHHAKAYQLLGMITQQMDDLVGAIEAYKTAITFGIDANWTATVACELANLYRLVTPDTPNWTDDDNAQTKAIACYKLAQELNPALLQVHYELAALQTEAGDLADALNQYDTILKLEGESDELHSFIGYLNWQLGHHAQAEIHYRKAILLSPHNPVTYNNLGVIYLDVQDNPAKALICFEQASQQDDAYVMAIFNQGRCHQSLGDERKACGFYHQAKALNAKKQEVSMADIDRRLAQCSRSGD
jgi:tetratricopeptide (TPR) repeat protein